MNQEFLQFCKLNSNSTEPFPLLLERFKKKNQNFDISDFISWKTNYSKPENENRFISEFYNYPFLRDQLFLSFFKTLAYETAADFEIFILMAQIDYYNKFINSEFDHKILTKSTEKVSKCPFAPRIKTVTPFNYEPISKIKYSLIENTHISDMNVDNLTVQLVKPGCERSFDAKFHVLLSGTHQELNFNDPEFNYIMLSDTKLTEIVPLNKDQALSSCIINEIFKVKQVITASDALFLFPSNVLVINTSDLDRLLNFIIYLNILKYPLNFNTLKKSGIASKTLEPSQLEPYADILTPEYIQNNSDLFQ